MNRSKKIIKSVLNETEEWPPQVGQEVLIKHQGKIGKVLKIYGNKYSVKVPTQLGPKIYIYDISLLYKIDNKII